MDSILCDELMIEIFQRLSPPHQPPPHTTTTTTTTSTTVALVSKRWLRLYRLSKTSLSINHLPNPTTILNHHYPYLTSLSLSTSSPPPSLSSLFSLSSSSPQLTSLSLPLSRPLNLCFLPSFPCLKHFSLFVSDYDNNYNNNNNNPQPHQSPTSLLKLESLSVSGLSWADVGLGRFWRSCAQLKKLQLKSCDGVGDGGSISSFVNCLKGLTELELRCCRRIVDGVLLKLAENSPKLTSLLIYDGGSKDGLLNFITNSKKSNIRKLDFRLPLDLDNRHLTAIALNFPSLSSLRLQSSCLVTDDGLKAFNESLEELGLINCDVVDQVPGLLTTLGQNLRKLRRLDLSHNEMLVDKELVSMLASIGGDLVELKLRGCKGLTSFSLMCMAKTCRNLEIVDIVNCCGIQPQAVEMFVSNSRRLRKVYVEEKKLSENAKIWASNRFIQVIV